MKEITETINSKFPELRDGRTLVAVSGGLDSVVLLRCMKNMEMDIAIAHVNYNLRGKDSKSDERFVRSLAEKIDVPVYVQTIDLGLHLKEYGGSLQEVARNIRYDWFEELCRERSFDYVVTAHHSDDQAETIVSRLSRDAGIDGLSGIPVRRGNIIRPLMDFNKSTLLAIATERGWSWREDRSNRSTDYERNRIRHEILPKMESMVPGIREDLLHIGEMYSELSDKMKKRYAAFRDSNLHRRSGMEVFNKDELQESYDMRDVLFRWLCGKGFTSGTIKAIGDNLMASPGKQFTGENGRVVIDRREMIYEPVENMEAVDIRVNANDLPVQLPNGSLNIMEEDVPGSFGDNDHEIWVDEAVLNWPLHIRTWKEGDSLQPLGMQGTKKVSDILIDEKVSLPLKNQALVLLSEGEIVWLVGYRQSDKYKITENTERSYKMKFIPNEV